MNKGLYIYAKRGRCGSVNGLQPNVRPVAAWKRQYRAHIRLESIVVKRARADRVHILMKHTNTIIYSISEKKRFFLVRETVLQ